MILVSLLFLIVLVVAHLADGLGKSLDLPLSMFRDGDYQPFGCLLFGLLLGIAVLMLIALHRARRFEHACILSGVAFFLLLVAVTPSMNGLHIFCSFVVLALLFAYYAVVFREAGAVWLWVHLTVPGLLVLATQCHSYGLWQKSLIVYFVVAVNVQHFQLTGSRERRGSGVPRASRLRRRVIYSLEPGRSWRRSQAARPRT